MYHMLLLKNTLHIVNRYEQCLWYNCQRYDISTVKLKKS